MRLICEINIWTKIRGESTVWRGGIGKVIEDDSCWFWEAIDVEPVTKTVEVDEVFSYRHYEAIGKPGMLLIHVNAHSGGGIS